MNCKAKKKFRASRKFLKFFIFWNLHHKKGLKGEISIVADSRPPRYVHTLMLRWYLSPSPNFFSGAFWRVLTVSFQCSAVINPPERKNAPLCTDPKLEFHLVIVGGHNQIEECATFNLGLLLLFFSFWCFAMIEFPKEIIYFWSQCILLNFLGYT